MTDNKKSVTQTISVYKEEADKIKRTADTLGKSVEETIKLFIDFVESASNAIYR